MQLPYSAEVYFVTLAEYNVTWRPVVVTGVAIMVAAIVLAMRRPSPGASSGASRKITVILAVGAFWTGAVYQLGMMADLNFMATAYGAGWIAQGVLILWSGLVRDRPAPAGTVHGYGYGAAGIAIAVFGLAGYPAIIALTGQTWPALPMAGTAAHPTAVVIAGLLLATRPRPPLVLFIWPAAWAAVAAFSGNLLGQPQDFSVSIAIIAATALAITARFRAA